MFLNLILKLKLNNWLFLRESLAISSLGTVHTLIVTSIKIRILL